MAWTQRGSGMTWGDVEDPIHWANEAGERRDYNPDDPSNWWRDWKTPGVADYSSFGQQYDPTMGGAMAAPTSPDRINAAPQGKTYADVLRDVSQLPGANAANTLLNMHRQGYLQQLPGFDANHWNSTAQPMLDKVMKQFNDGDSASMMVASVVLAPLVAYAAGAAAGGAGAAASEGAAAGSAAAGGSAAEGVGAAAAAGAGAEGAAYAMPAAAAESASSLSSMGLVETAPGVWAQTGAAGYTGVSGLPVMNNGASGMPSAASEPSTTSMLSGPSGTASTGTISTGGLMGSLSNPQLLGAAGGALLGGMGGSSSGTTTTTEGIPDWLMPYVKPALDKYSTDLQNYQTDPYGIMPSAMTQFKNTIGGMYLDPSTNKYLEDYFRLGAERIKGSLSPSFGHMQAFGQHSGYNEALSRGLGDFSVGLYGGAYEKERDRQNQMTAAAPGFLGQSAQAQFQPYSQYLSSVGALGKSKETPYFTNPWSSILGGAMAGSQFGSMWK